MKQPLCIVIGAGAGIGFGAARRFAAGGFQIALIARRKEPLALFETELRAAGFTAKSFTADAGEEEELRRVLEHIRQEMGDCDALIYNAYGSTNSPPSTLSPSDFAKDLQVNAVSPLVAAQTVLPAMRERGRGSIIFTGGGLAFEPYFEVASLAVGKAAIRSLAFSLFQELAPAGIHAATVTVAGIVGDRSGELAPSAIAEEFWRLHSQPKGEFEPEIVIKAQKS